MSLKELLDKRVRRYRSKHMKPPEAVVREEAKWCAELTWFLLKWVIFFKQKRDNQVVVYLGIATVPATHEHFFIHKMGYLANTYRHLYPIKYPKETLEILRELAEKDGLRVVEANHEADYCERENENSFANVKWKIHIVYDVPEN